VELFNDLFDNKGTIFFVGRACEALLVSVSGSESVTITKFATGLS